MEVKLDKRYPVSASIAQAWAVLSDMRATAACMPGAAITEQLDATHYKGTVKSKVGPAVMSFGGDIEVLAIDAATHSMQMLGKGSDTGGSSASMNLAAHLEPGETPAACVLVGVATIMVNGKLAQFGSRLLVPVSDAMLAQFAGNFQAAAAALPGVAANPTAVVGVEEGATATPSAATVAAHATAPATATAPTHPRAPAPANELNALGLMWTVFKSWLAGLFGKRG